MNAQLSKETISKETYLAAVNRIDALERILRQIAAVEVVSQVNDDSAKMRIMGALARSVLT